MSQHELFLLQCSRESAHRPVAGRGEGQWAEPGREGNDDENSDDDDDDENKNGESPLVMVVVVVMIWQWYEAKSGGEGRGSNSECEQVKASLPLVHYL